MKKNSSLLLSGLLISGMVLGATVTPTTVHAATDTTTETAANVTNNVSYTDVATNKTVTNKNLTGTQGSEITYVPDGYAFVGSNPLFGADQANINVKVTKMITVKVNYVDADNNVVSSESVNGGNGNDYKLTNLPKGYNWNNDAEQTIKLEEGKEYNVPVTKSQEATTDDSTGVVTVNGNDAQLVTSYGNVISGRILKANTAWKSFGSTVIKGETYYKVGSNEWVKASDVTFKANEATVTPLKGVAKANALVQLVTKDGDTIKTRALTAGTDWKIFNKMVLNGKTYYQVATNEWADASLMTITSTEGTDNNTSSDDAVVTVYKSTVTTLDNGQNALLYTKDGVQIKTRALQPNTAWKTAHKMVLKGVTYYQVATNEWVKAQDIQ